MLSVTLLEPGSFRKQRRFSQSAKGPGQNAYISPGWAKERLREIRNDSVNKMEALLNRLESNLVSAPGVRVTVASDAREAAVSILRFAHDTRKVAFNRSAVVRNELAPVLFEAGFQMVNTYQEELSHLDNRFTNASQLPSLPFNCLWESWDRPKDLMVLRRAESQSGVRDVVGLLGVNAAGSDGSLFFFQHAHNIGRVFTQAAKLVLVVPLDKVVAGRDEAKFQTSCMAAFGSPAALLEMKGNSGKGITLESLPLGEFCEQILVLLLDNGRRQLLGGVYQDVLACISCRACLLGCSTYQLFEEGGGRNPREYLFSYLTGHNPSLEFCISCGLCQASCPLEIDIPWMIMQARAEAMRENGLPLGYSFLIEFERLAKIGGLAPHLVNGLLGSHPLRWIGEKMLGISRERLPLHFQGRGFVQRHARQREKRKNAP